MSTQEIVITTCDRCGAAAPDDPVVIGIGGEWRELDLCGTHRATFDTRVASWFTLATRPPVAPPAPRGRSRDQLPAAGRRRRPAAEPTAVAVAFREAVADR